MCLWKARKPQASPHSTWTGLRACAAGCFWKSDRVLDTLSKHGEPVPILGVVVANRSGIASTSSPPGLVKSSPSQDRRRDIPDPRPDRYQSLASRHNLNFIGSMSGPVTTKWSRRRDVRRTSVRATHHSLNSRPARAHAHARARSISSRGFLQVPMNSLQRCAGLGQTGWANSRENCFRWNSVGRNRLSYRDFARQVTSAKRGSNINQITSQRIVQFQEAKLWQKGQRQISLRKTPNSQCR